MTPETRVLVIVRNKGMSNCNFYQDTMTSQEWNWLKGVARDYSINRCEHTVASACNIG